MAFAIGKERTFYAVQQAAVETADASLYEESTSSGRFRWQLLDRAVGPAQQLPTHFLLTEEAPTSTRMTDAVARFQERGKYLYSSPIKSKVGEYMACWLWKAVALAVASLFYRIVMVFVHLAKGECTKALKSLIGAIALPVIAGLSFAGGFVGLAKRGLDVYAEVERWINGHHTAFKEGSMSYERVLKTGHYLAECLQPVLALDNDSGVLNRELGVRTVLRHNEER